MWFKADVGCWPRRGKRHGSPCSISLCTDRSHSSDLNFPRSVKFLSRSYTQSNVQFFTSQRSTSSKGELALRRSDWGYPYLIDSVQRLVITLRFMQNYHDRQFLTENVEEMYIDFQMSERPSPTSYSSVPAFYKSTGC